MVGRNPLADFDIFLSASKFKEAILAGPDAGNDESQEYQKSTRDFACRNRFIAQCPGE